MGGHNNWPYIINLGNSIIGVSVLAMPFCFQQCGILLGMIVLLFCTWLTLISCQLLMRAGIHSRRRSYEFLAYHTHGATGKLLSELGMIGMQVGTLIAQIVVIGDLGPAIFSKFLGIENTSGLRTFLILALCLCVGLPLGLLKDLRTVSQASTVCISFYCIFILYVIGLSMPNIRSGEWYHKVLFWRPEGFFQCLPILSFSFGCQTQLFLLYDALPDPSLKAISGVISSAVNLCAVAYLLVGFFGYVAFHNIDVPGDVIGVFPNTFFADLMKICFVFSIVITFPVIIFPCRSSIYTLVFAKAISLVKTKDVIDSDGYLPEKLFKGITVFIVISCMILGILIPNVEFILGINGAIMGTLICYIFPAMFFLKVMGNKQDSKGMAQIVFILGVTILLLSTFATLSSQGKGDHHPKPAELNEPPGPLMLPRDLDGHLPGPIDDEAKVAEQLPKPVQTQPPVQGKGDGKDEVIVKDDARQEPPNPDPPDVKPAGAVLEKVKEAAEDSESVGKRESPQKNPPIVIESPADKDKNDDKKVDKQIKDVEDIAKAADANKAKELELQEKEKKQDELLQQLEKHREEQEKLIQEQRQLLREFKDHHEKDLKNELNQEKEKLQQQVKREAVQGGNAQNAEQVGQVHDTEHLQHVKVQGDSVKHVQRAGEQAVRPQVDDLHQAGNLQLPAQQGRLELLSGGKPYKEQLLHADPQEPNANLQPQLPLHNQQVRRANVDPQIPQGDESKHMKQAIAHDLKPQARALGENPPKQQQQQLLKQQDQQLRGADNLRQADPNSVNYVAHPQNQQGQQQQPLVRESDPLNVPNHPQQPQILVEAGQAHKADHGGRAKRSVDVESKIEGNAFDDTRVDVNNMEKDRVKEHVDLHVISNKQIDHLASQEENVVNMNMKSASDKDGLNNNHLKNLPDKSFNEEDNIAVSKLIVDVKEKPMAGVKVDEVVDKKRNEEMSRKLKAIDSKEKASSINAGFIQPLTNIGGRHLLEHKRRD